LKAFFLQINHRTIAPEQYLQDHVKKENITLI